ncbi:aminoglycoside phosphotransferase family protein [Paenibacillus sp. OV219]|uniref:aminoglycoside phosphotransferase family protein n=1 Tax=Paenibacillus sp. OV219 TaxID=1884377 RepID=UPI0008C937CB|nr:aminoglycoside phosphotransferase family protein [Paenibacillus sp. OV219]SEO65613.1 Aminoglycoside/hydroxyurea antibiotic resistance kinase [Paenibacillus sp. OV219]
MNKHYIFNPNEIENIINKFGNEFYEKVQRDIEVYADKWALTSFQLVPSYSAKLVFKCYSESYGNAVLKIGQLSQGVIATELSTLREYGGRRFGRVFDTDIENGVILEECLRPGIPLRNESSLEERLSVFASLFNDLHITPAKADLYPSYTEWVSKITEYMSKREDCKELYRHMKKAEDICLSVAASYSKQMLLHGDFHHDNILLGDNGKYVIIDPKGVIGDPVFDVPRFILNEFGDEVTHEVYQKINDIIGSLEEKLHIPNDILRKCLYVETAMGECWMVEDGAPPEDFPRLLKAVALAESLLYS